MAEPVPIHIPATVHNGFLINRRTTCMSTPPVGLSTPRLARNTALTCEDDRGPLGGPRTDVVI